MGIIHLEILHPNARHTDVVHTLFNATSSDVYALSNRITHIKHNTHRSLNENYGVYLTYSSPGESKLPVVSISYLNIFTSGTNSRRVIDEFNKYKLIHTI